ncbi:DEAD/DEAH box helicase [Enterococcus sp. CWB-B31]|uniref:DEAD/DEAH box helicase n=1 Tax=Enterococcus sp. CWB-B31 TaxID=2885159 RepID=UPI001E64C96C|nr:DEAD/DEAH box helicase [Enterococcus sp. CWB-B31]MCB5956137.1 DEAD/DEAH box helicase [Enterococcus sp. CWB-B31]
MNFVNQLPEVWQEKWQTSGFNEPSAIQKKSFQPLSEGKNVRGISPTGTGKTLAYLLPLLLRTTAHSGNQLLILAPSQELAVQIGQVAQEWGNLLQLKTQTLIGGANVKRQIEKLKKKPEVLIGTPGRIIELIRAKKIKSHQLKTIVMDEADQLLQKTDLDLTRQILQSAPVDFQLAFYSATADRIESEVSELAEEVQTIDVSEEDQSAGTIHHYYIEVPFRKRKDFLQKMLHVPEFYGMVFFNQLSDLGAVEEKMIYDGLPILGLASDQNKQLRKLAVSQFSNKRVKMLLTTDVGARGLDFTEVAYIINADVPLDAVSYAHRAGRTGRMGAEGAVITFVNDRTKRDFQRLMKAAAVSAKEIFLYGAEFHETRKETEAGHLKKEK